MPRSHAPQLRTMVVEQVRSGRRVGEVTAGLGIAKQQCPRRVGQDKIDRGELARDARVRADAAAGGPGSPGWRLS